MKLNFQQQCLDGDTRRVVTLTADGLEPIEIFYEMKGETLPAPDVLDGFVMGIIFYAMQRGEDLHVCGPVSSDLIPNMAELQDAWALWRPERYKKVTITADVVRDVMPVRPRRATAAFSGGVDSIFTVLQHNKMLRTDRSYPLDDSVVLVSGFDVPLSEPEQMVALKERITPLAEHFGLKVKEVRTNSRALGIQDWLDSHMAQLAACLHNFSHLYSHALVGSSEPYDHLIIPWGSSPLTDHLLSGGAMRLVHDGAGYSRTEKVAVVARHPVATKVLKVCWQGKERGRNCGVCEKCIRTQLNFEAVGESAPSCFDAPLDIRAITRIPLTNQVQYAELASIVRYATRHGRSGPWLDRLQQRVRAYRPPSKFGNLKRKAKRFVEAMLTGDIEKLKGMARKRLSIGATTAGGKQT